MENQEINLDKIHRLIDSLQSQATEGSTQGMLSAAQLIVAELQHILAKNGQTPSKSGNVSVVMPFAGKQIVSHVPLEEPASPMTDSEVPGESSLQPPTIITETQPSEAVDNHRFGSVPTPPAQIETSPAEPATEQAAPAPFAADADLPSHSQPVQKELFTLAEEEEFTPLKPSEYPTSIPSDSPAIQQTTQTQQAQQTQQDVQKSGQEAPQLQEMAPQPIETEPANQSAQPAAGTHVQPPMEQAPDFETSSNNQTSEHLQIDQTEEEKQRHLAFISDNFSTWADYGLTGEAPTLVQNQPLTKHADARSSDYNNNYQQQHYRELNEQLGQPQEEWAHKMQSTPIENLSSAIGVNDRYLYISELFRGDESMYERSIITLNKFSNFHEAHAWSERELRLKLGWDTQNPITQQFEQLIKRRFMHGS